MIALQDLTVGQVSGMIAAAVFTGMNLGRNSLGFVNASPSAISSAHSSTHYSARIASTTISCRHRDCRILVEHKARKEAFKMLIHT